MKIKVKIRKVILGESHQGSVLDDPIVAEPINFEEQIKLDKLQKHGKRR